MANAEPDRLGLDRAGLRSWRSWYDGRVTHSTIAPRRLAAAAAFALALSACGPSRIEIEPGSVQLFARGQKGKLHAVPMAKNGRALPDERCAWSSSDEKVARVEGPHNEATVTAVGQGRAVARCSIGKLSAEVPVAVSLVTRVEVTPRDLELRVLDEATPTALAVRALDGEGRDVQGRMIGVRCLDENVCRGDDRGQVWAVGPGSSRVVVQVDDGQAEAQVRVVDARSAAARPHAVSGNPMEHLDDPAPAERKRRSKR